MQIEYKGNQFDSQILAQEIASEILKYKGQISLSEIRALPFVETKEGVIQIQYYLSSKYRIQISQIAVETEPILRLEQIIKLKIL